MSEPKLCPQCEADAWDVRVESQTRFCRLCQARDERNDARQEERALRERLAAAERENITLRMAMGDVATNLGNGAAAAPNCTLEFLAECVPNEVKLVCADLRQRLAIAESTSKLHYDRETEMIRRAMRAEADGAAMRRLKAFADDIVLAMKGVSWSRDIQKAPNTITASDGEALATALFRVAFYTAALATYDVRVQEGK